MSLANRTKRKMVTSYMNELEVAMLDELSEQTGLGQSKTLISLVRQEHWRVFGRGPLEKPKE